MPDNDKPDTVAEFEEQYQVELATLSDEARAQVIESAKDAEFDGELPDLEINEAVVDADQADWARQNAEGHKEEQLKAEDRGDYETAREEAVKAEAQLKNASFEGGRVDKAVNEAELDVQELDAAEWERDNAEAETVDAEAYAEGGDVDMAEDSMDDADASDDQADENVSQSDGTDDATNDSTITYDS